MMLPKSPRCHATASWWRFCAGPGSFGNSANTGQVWFKSLPNGEPFQLTKTAFRKQTINFSQDGSRVYFTQIEGRFTWNTYELPLLGGQEPKLFMANATGLSWIGGDRVLFSTIRTGIHMKLSTSNASRTDERDIYVPPDHMQGMVHRSALSPDGKWVLLVEMDSEWWRRCRVVPFDGSSAGRQVGPEGSCTWAQWSPDGKWMYFTVDTRTAGFHVWRQRFPDGAPQQLTPSGASEEEGLAIMPDGKSFITTAGTQQSAIWLHDDKTGEKQITSEGYSFFPTLVAGWQEGLLLAAGHGFALLLQRRAVGFRRRDRSRGTALSGFSAHAFLNLAGWEKGGVRDRTGPGPIGDLGRLA